MKYVNRVGIGLLYVLAMAGGSYLAFRPTFDSSFTRVVGDPGDTMLNHYLLEHSRRALFDSHYRGTLLSPPFFFPTPLVLGYSENLLGVAPLYWGLRVVLPEVPAFQVWMILLNVLNLIAFARVARWLGAGPVFALLGGYVFAFGLVQIDQVKHAQMIPRFWMPLAVYYAYRVSGLGSRNAKSADEGMGIEGPAAPDACADPIAPNVGAGPLAPRDVNRLCACVFLQCLTCVYTGWFLALGVASFVLIAAALRPGGLRQFIGIVRRSPRIWAIVGAWSVALLVFFMPYFLANRGVSRSYGECVAGMPTVFSWLTTAEGGRWSATLKPFLPAEYGENKLFCGFMLYALMLGAALWAYQSPPTAASRLCAALLLTAAVWVLITLRFGSESSAWWVVRFIPGGQAIRCTSRVYVLVYLFGTLAAMIACTQLLTARFALRRIILVGVCGVVVFEQTGYEPISFHTDEFYPVAERCARSLVGAKADAGYVVPSYGLIPGTHGELIGMWTGLYANVPVVNGYSGRWPDRFPIGYEMDERLLREWFAGRFHGRVAIIDPEVPEAVRIVVIE